MDDTQQNKPKSDYFAAQDAPKTAGIVLDKANKWFNNLLSTGYKDKLRDMWLSYHGAYYNTLNGGHQVSFSGEQGEFTNLPVNHLRNLAQHILVMTTSNRPSMDARATNRDYKSLVQTYLANDILDYYLREKRLEKYLKNAVEFAIVLGAGWVKIEWDATAGQIYDYMLDEVTGEPDHTRPIYDGDVKFSNLSPFDVVMDPTRENDDHDWILVRTSKNKYDLSAKYPEYKLEIEKLETKSDVEKMYFGLTNLDNNTEDVFIYEFYHKPTESLPNGRYIMFLSDTLVLYDGGMPYRTLPVFRITPGNILGTPFGYTPLFDILPLQQGINTLYSVILSNQNAFGVQNIFVKHGSDINTNRLEGGLNVITGNEMPQSLNLTQTPKEIFEFLSLLEKTIETISGVNSVARGNADNLGSNPSGTAMALIQSMSLQFMSGLQESYVQLIEDIGSALIKILQDYAHTPRLISIVGKANRTKMKEFSSDGISNIARVVVDVGNPLAKTTAGRVQMADNLLQYGGKNGVPLSAKQYVNLINTGRLDVMTDDIEFELLNIEDENESMVEGEIPTVTVLDDHKQHIMDHRKVIADCTLRKDAGLVQRVTQHIMEHINQLRSADPSLLQLLNQQPLPPLQQPQQPGSPETPPSGGPPTGPPPGAPPVNGSPAKEMMPPEEGQGGPGVANGHVEGPGLPPNGIRVPQPAKPPEGQFHNLPTSIFPQK